MVKYRLGELFSGPGGMSYGAINAKVVVNGETHEIVHEWASDYDEDSCKTYSRNICKTESGEISDSVHHIDVKELDIDSLPAIDILAFGFPCNDFSQVGESKGMEGDFGMLYKYGVAALNKHNPMAFVAENVSGINSNNEGKAFAQILKELRKAGEHGYNITKELHAFEQLGVPQARHRYIIVGIRKDLKKTYRMHAHTHPHSDRFVSSMQALEKPPHHLSEFGIRGTIPDGHPDHRIREPDGVVKRRLEAIPEGENAWCDAVENDPELRINTKTKLSSIYRRLDRNRPAYTVTGSGGGGTHMYHWEIPRALSNREKARLQTFPDNYEFWGGVTSVRKQIGMAVPPYGAKLIFEMLLATLADAPSLKLTNNVIPGKETFWKHLIESDSGVSATLQSDISTENMENGRVMMILAGMSLEELESFQQLIADWTSNGLVVQCVVNEVWRGGMDTAVRDTLMTIEENNNKFTVRTSFVKGNSPVLMMQNQDGEVESMYACTDHHDTNASFLELRKISINETLADHLEYLFVESQYSELPGLAGIATPEAMAKKIEDDKEAFDGLPNHQTVIPSGVEAPTESIDLVEIAARSPVSSFNLEFGRGRLQNGIRSPRRWTEIELTIGGRRYPALPNQFEAHTHDGKVLKLKRSGGSADLGKDLAYDGTRPPLGVWLKGLLYRSGALAPGERITEATFEEYGKTTLDFYKIDDGVYYLDFEGGERN